MLSALKEGSRKNVEKAEVGVNQIENSRPAGKPDGEKKEKEKKKKNRKRIPSTHVPLPGLFLCAHEVELPVFGPLKTAKS